MEFNKHKHVVIIYPHPDDESFGASGTITYFREAGVPVTYLCGTLGEMGRNMGSPLFANRETLPEIRKQELLEVAKVLDIEVKMLGYRDKTLEFEDKDKVAEHLKSLLEEIAPSLVITHYPGYAVHPDHNALGAAAVEAVKRMDSDKRPELWAQAISNDRIEVLGKPDIVIDADPIFDKKVQAIKTHRSQAEAMIKRMEQASESSGENEFRKRMRYEGFYIWSFDD
ncbi:MAG: bacillithiol biosynthesis deacetylase BshB2 [Bacillaceae bacterium]|nr:bacillithiol biosynthesis deacetylase BshB2 [Bacillaceae bacterium]